MKIVLSVSGVPIRLTVERFGHIQSRHPEMRDQEERILKTVSAPDYAQEGEAGTLIAVKHYQQTPLTEKFCAVVYREVSEDDGFVMTAYFTSKPAEWRRIVWKL